MLIKQIFDYLEKFPRHPFNEWHALVISKVNYTEEQTKKWFPGLEGSPPESQII